MIWPEPSHKDDVLKLIEKHDLITESMLWEHSVFDDNFDLRTEIPVQVLLNI